jgi:hypothetical protein
MGDANKRLNDDRRSGKDRRRRLDTPSDAEKKLIGQRRSNKDRRSGTDRRLTAAKQDPR